MDYITSPKDYWIAPSAINITRNALGNPNRIQGSVAGGAVISCYIAGVNGLELDNGRNPKRWVLNLSPTYFTTFTAKYVYVAIPRTEAVGTQAVVVFPSELLDIYGKNDNDEQIGSVNYYYIWLQGILSSSGTYGDVNREWTAQIDFGKLGTYEDIIDMSETDWYTYSKVNQIVTFLKPIFMKAGSYFQNLILGNKELTGVATAATPDDFIDSETLVVTPSYLHDKYLSRKNEDTAEEQIGFLKGLWIGVKDMFGWDKNGNITAADGVFSGMITALRAVIGSISSPNYQGGQLTGTGWQITNSDDNGNSRLEVDNLVVRMKMLVNVLEARKYVALGGNYVYSPASSVIEQVDYYDANGTLLGYETIKVPFLVRLVPILANTKLYSRSRVISNKGDVDMSDVAYFRCWIKADDGTTRTINTWQPGMLARCQTLDIDAGGGGAHSEVYYEDKPYELTAGGNKLYWRETIATGQAHYPVNDDGNVHSYVDLSNVTGHFLVGSDVPGVGDSIVCYGGTKVDYANVIAIETVGADAPAIKEMMGVGLQTIGQDNTSGQLPVFAVTADNLRTRISPKAGNRFIAPEFYIEATVGGDRTNLATFIVNTEGVLSYVKGVIDNGKNLLRGVIDGAGWRGATGSITPHSITGNVIDNWIPCDSGDIYVVSPDVSVVADTAYTYSFDVPNLVSGAITVLVYSTSLQLLFTLSSNTSGRRKVTFTPTANATVMLYVAVNKLHYPQLEVGSNATAFEVPTTSVMSQIKQTADNIHAAVVTELGETGIDISGSNRTIDLIANKVTFSYYDNGTKKSDKIWIDPATGALHAVDGNFSGTITATSGTFAGTLNAAGGTFTGSLVGATGTFSGSISSTNGFIELTTSKVKDNIDWRGLAVMGKEEDAISFIDLATIGARIQTGNSYGRIALAKYVVTGQGTVTTTVPIVLNADDGSIEAKKAEAEKATISNVLQVNGLIGANVHVYTAATSGEILQPTKNTILVSGSNNFFLPNMAYLQQALNRQTFAIELTIIAGDSSSFTVFGRRSDTAASATCPYLRSNDYADMPNGIAMAQGDVLTLVLTNASGVFDAFIKSHLN